MKRSNKTIKSGNFGKFIDRPLLISTFRRVDIINIGQTDNNVNGKK